MRPKILHWFLLVAYALCGAGVFGILSAASDIVAEVDTSFPLPIRVIQFVSPAGWLALAFFCLSLSLRLRSETARLILGISFHVVAIGVLLTLIFTDFHRPADIRRPSMESSSNDVRQPSIGHAVYFQWSCVCSPFGLQEALIRRFILNVRTPSEETTEKA